MKRYLYILAIAVIFFSFVVFQSDFASKLSAMVSGTDQAGTLPPSLEEEIYCENFQEILKFEIPEEIVWTARLDGCLESCLGGAFTRLPADEKHPRFSGRYSDGSEGIPAEFLKENLTLKIYGKWTGIDYDHPTTVFGGRCVPIVEIEKIEAI